MVKVGKNLLDKKNITDYNIENQYQILLEGYKKTGNIRRLDNGKNTKDGKTGNMYKYLGYTEDERQKILNCLNTIGNWILKRCAEIIKEDVNGIKVKC